MAKKSIEKTKKEHIKTNQEGSDKDVKSGISSQKFKMTKLNDIRFKPSIVKPKSKEK